MKKHLLTAFTLLLIIVLGFSSCRRCTRCTAYDKDTGDIMVNSPEFCGSREDVIKFQDAYQITYGVACDVVCD